MSKVGNANRYARIRREREEARDKDVAALIDAGCDWVPGFPDYLASPCGDIYSTLRRGVIKMSPGVKPAGYEFVGLRVDGKAQYQMVHRLVAMTFIPNPNGLPEVNHIDGDKRNNSRSNLEWCTRKHNHQHAASIGLIGAGAKAPAAKLTPDEARAIFRSGGSYKEIGSRFNVCAQTVCNIKLRRCYAGELRHES